MSSPPAAWKPGLPAPPWSSPRGSQQLCLQWADFCPFLSRLLCQEKWCVAALLGNRGAGWGLLVSAEEEQKGFTAGPWPVPVTLTCHSRVGARKPRKGRQGTGRGRGLEGTGLSEMHMGWGSPLNTCPLPSCSQEGLVTIAPVLPSEHYSCPRGLTSLCLMVLTCSMGLVNAHWSQGLSFCL